MKQPTFRLLILGAIPVLIVFFAVYGLLVFVNRQASVELQTVAAFSPIVVGIAEVLIAMAMIAQTAQGEYSFLLKRSRNITRL